MVFWWSGLFVLLVDFFVSGIIIFLCKMFPTAAFFFMVFHGLPADQLCLELRLVSQDSTEGAQRQ